MSLWLQSPSFDLWCESSCGTFRFQSPGRTVDGVIGVEVVRRNHVLTLTSKVLSVAERHSQAVRDAQGAGEELFIRYHKLHHLRVEARFRLYPTRPFALFRVSVTNLGPEPVLLRRFFFQTLPNGIHPLLPPTGFYRNGWQSWSHAGFLPVEAHDYVPPVPLRHLQGPMTHNAHTPWANKSGRFWSESVGAMITPREALIAGGASLAEQFVQVGADAREGHLSLIVQSQGDDVPLLMGETRASEWFYLEWMARPNVDPLAQYAHAVVRQMELSPARTGPTGWCSWYIFWNKVTEDNLIDNLATAALLADEMPLQVIQLDEGYQSQWGDWTTRNERFPHDMRWLAERIRGSEFTPGLWLGPLTVHPKSALAREHPDWLLRDEKGKPVSAGWVDRFMVQALDPTHPGVEDHVRQLVETAVHKWGYHYLKLDFLYASALAGKRHNPSMTRAQSLRHALRIMRQAAGEETYLVGCGAPLGPAVGLVDAMRIGPDTAPHWEPQYRGVKRLFRDNPVFPSLRNSLRNVAARAWMQGRWWLNDPDTLMLRDTQTELTAYEVRSQVTLLGLTGGLTVLSDDLARLSAERRRLLAMLLPPLVEGGDVLDLFDEEMPGVVITPIARPWGHWRLLGLFNWKESPVERMLPPNLSLDKRKSYHLMDFWARHYLRLGPEVPPPVFHIPPHGCMLLGLRLMQSQPHLVGTTFHITQGGEVSDWHVDKRRIDLTLSLGRKAEGEVWLSLPTRPQAVLLNETPLPATSIRAVAPGIWAIRCRVNRTAVLEVDLLER